MRDVILTLTFLLRHYSSAGDEFIDLDLRMLTIDVCIRSQ